MSSEPSGNSTGLGPISDARAGPTAYIGDGVVVGSNVIVGPGAVVLAAEGDADQLTELQAGAEIGANATVLAGVVIGYGARVVPGAVVDRSVPPWSIVEGNPARIVGYLETGPVPAPQVVVQPDGQDTRVRGVVLQQLRTAHDLRGRLSVAEFGLDVPFQPSRCFLVYDVPTAETRGAHAHRRCAQLLIAVHGGLSVVADDGANCAEFRLDMPSIGLLLPAMTWGIQYRFSPDAVLLVLASDPYDPDDYIRDYPTFLAECRAGRG